MILIGIGENIDKNAVFEGTLKVFREFSNMPKIEVALAHYENGKPYVNGQEAVKVSVSHSGKYIVIALSNNEVGVDIQEKKEIDFQKISERYGFNATDKEEFYKKFTLAEAYAKTTSEGLPKSLKQADNINGTTYHFIKDYTLSVVGEGSKYFIVID